MAAFESAHNRRAEGGGASDSLMILANFCSSDVRVRRRSWRACSTRKGALNRPGSTFLASRTNEEGSTNAEDSFACEGFTPPVTGVSMTDARWRF